MLYKPVNCHCEFTPLSARTSIPKQDQKIVIPQQLPPLPEITPDTELTSELFQLLFPNLHQYRFNYDTQFHSCCNKFYNLHGFQPSIAVYCADSYFGGTCNPDFTFNPEYLLNHTLCPYGLPERRNIDPNTSLPVNFNPLTEVYIINVSFKYNIKPNRIPSFTQSRLFYSDYCTYGYNDNRFVPQTRWNKSGHEDHVGHKASTYTITQPQWEGIKERYYLSDVTYNYALVFKAKPFLFNLLIPYAVTKNDRSLFTNYMYLLKSINSIYPAIKAFYSAYHRERFLTYFETFLDSRTPINDLFIHERQPVEPGSLIYTSYNCFAIANSSSTVYTEPDTLGISQKFNYTLHPSLHRFSQTNTFIEGDIIIPKYLLMPELLRIKDNLTRQCKLELLNEIKSIGEKSLKREHEREIKRRKKHGNNKEKN